MPVREDDVAVAPLRRQEVLRSKKRLGWCIVANVLTSWLPIIVLSSEIVSGKTAVNGVCLFMGIGTVLLTIVFGCYVWKWCRLSRSYGLLISIPVTVVPFFGTIGFVMAYQHVSASLLGHELEEFPHQTPVRQCRCGGRMAVIGGTQVNALAPKKPIGFQLFFQCQQCRRTISVSSWLVVVHEIFAAMFLGVLAIGSAGNLWHGESTFKNWAILAIAGIGWAWFVWKILRGVWNRLLYRTWAQ